MERVADRSGGVFSLRARGFARMPKKRIFSGLWRSGHISRCEKFFGDEMEARNMRAIVFLRYET